MTELLTVYDYGHGYEYEEFDVTWYPFAFSDREFIVKLEGTPETTPWVQGVCGDTYNIDVKLESPAFTGVREDVLVRLPVVEPHQSGEVTHQIEIATDQAIEWHHIREQTDGRYL